MSKAKRKPKKDATPLFTVKVKERALTVGQTVQYLRMARDMTQAELAVASQLDPSVISRLERGERGAALDTLRQLAEGLHVLLTDLVGGSPKSYLDSLIATWKSKGGAK